MIEKLTNDIFHLLAAGTHKLERKKLYEYASVPSDVFTTFEFLLISLRSTPAAEIAVKQVQKCNLQTAKPTPAVYRRLAHNRLQGRCTMGGLDFVWESRRAYGYPEFRLKYIAFADTDSEEVYWIDWHPTIDEAEDYYEELSLPQEEQENSCASLTTSSVDETDADDEVYDDDCFAVHHSLRLVKSVVKTPTVMMDETEASYWERYDDEICC